MMSEGRSPRAIILREALGLRLDPTSSFEGEFSIFPLSLCSPNLAPAYPLRSHELHAL
jgi:hypothetical protein